jgi:hypothetical protein
MNDYAVPQLQWPIRTARRLRALVVGKLFFDCVE